MKTVIVLGATGFVGSRLMSSLKACPDLVVKGVARSIPKNDSSYVSVDVSDGHRLQEVLSSVDCVVNCIAGDAKALVGSTRALVEAVSRIPTIRVVHLSSMAVYGGVGGRVDEGAPISSDGGWYSTAKIESEELLSSLVSAGRSVVIFRPGCIYGPGSSQWTSRIARLIESGRLGDLGEEGDGWSNLVYIDDVCDAIRRAVLLEESIAGVFNLAAMPQLRWNSYFIKMACAIGVKPVRLSRRRLVLDSKVLSPFLKLAEIFLKKLKLHSASFPEIQSPSLVRLWNTDLSMDSCRVESALGVRWTSLEEGLYASVEWLRSQR